MLCPGCGNEIEQGDPCVICEDRAQRREEQERRQNPPEQDRPEWLDRRKRDRLTLCPDCGYQVGPDGDCDCRAVEPEADTDPADESTRLCGGCGNEVRSQGDCPICAAGRAPRKRSELVMCPGCGNDVEDIHTCPICLDGRATGPRVPEEERGVVCPSCDQALEAQEWDGTDVLMCSSCHGCLFSPGDLEQTLDKLRDGEPKTADLRTVVDEFRKRLRSKLPSAVRYKPCPYCGLSMTRRAYKRLSGIVLDVCGQHGTWVNQNTFGELADFVTRGGDAFTTGGRR